MLCKNGHNNWKIPKQGYKKCKDCQAINSNVWLKKYSVETGKTYLPQSKQDSYYETRIAPYLNNKDLNGDFDLFWLDLINDKDLI